VTFASIVNEKLFLNEPLVAKLHTLRKTIAPEQPWLREEMAMYITDDEGQMTKDEYG